MASIRDVFLARQGRALLFAVVALALFAGQFRPAAAVEVQRVVSPGGIEAWLVEDHSNPIIALNLAFRGRGGSLDPVGKEGLANMVSGLIDEGAGELDSQAFRERMEDHRISLSFSAGLDQFGGELMTLTEHREIAFELLRLALTAPRFDEEPVARIRSQIQVSLARQAEDPDSLAGRGLRKLLFPGDPYGRNGDGTPASVAAITIQDMKDFVARHLARDSLLVGVVGDVSPEELGRLLDSTFGALPVSAPPAPLPEIEPALAGGVAVITKPIPQSVVALGHAGIKRDDPDFYAAYVVNYILGGGGFASRLYNEVREKRGLAYSVYSYLYPFDRSALVLGGVATQNGRLAESLDIIRTEWRRMAEEGPSEAELAAAKRYLTGSFPLRFSSSGHISGMLVNMQMDRLGIDYLDKRNGYIEAVTVEDARRVAKRLYDAERLTIVVVGQPEGVTGTLEPPDLEG